jgi:hypothetical protein
MNATDATRRYAKTTILSAMNAKPRRTMAHHKKRRPPNARAGCKMCKPWKISGMSEAKTLSHGEQLQLFREHDDYGDNVDLALETSWAPPREDGFLRGIEQGFNGETTVTLENYDNRYPYRHTMRCSLTAEVLAPFMNQHVLVTVANNWVVTGIEELQTDQ